VALIENTAEGAGKDTVFAVLEEMGRFHPSEPHWYLPPIGTDPAQQGKGYGSALLRHASAICDQEKMPAHLEATSVRSVPLLSAVRVRSCRHHPGGHLAAHHGLRKPR
jgi:GNAT superfamily N-acetyltransferase